MSGKTFRALLETGNFAGLLKWSRLVQPVKQQPKDLAEAEIMMHSARTQMETLPIRKRLYSHHWLTERGLPSQLPLGDQPVVVSAVGIAVKASNPEMAPVAKMVEKAMADAVEDCYANGDVEPALVSKRMAEARARTYQQLVGKAN